MLIPVTYHGREWPRLDLALRVSSYILNDGQKRGARRAFDSCGLVICCDEVWFPKPEETAYRLAADDRDWEVEICFANRNLPSLLSKTVRFEGKERFFVRAEVTNPSAFENAMTLLRMFGPEEAFSGK